MTATEQTVESRATETSTDAQAARLAGKYLTFKLGEQSFGIGILKVVEIIKVMEITEVPITPNYVRGVLNLRGKVISVAELRKKFNMESCEDTNETCIIVVNAGDDSGQDLQMGILVDAVSEVLEIPPGDIEPTPDFGGATNTDFILGMAKAADGVKMLIDIDRVLETTQTNAASLDTEVEFD